MTKKCPECQDTGIIDEPGITYEWDTKRDAEEIIYYEDCACVNCGHVWNDSRRGNYRIAGEVLDEQRAKVHLLWEFYDHIIAHQSHRGVLINYLHDDEHERHGAYSALLESLVNLRKLRMNAIAVAKERKEQSL